MDIDRAALELTISDHMPFEGAGGSEPGDAGCLCGAVFPAPHYYTWLGYCAHLAEVIAAHLKSKGAS
jgi:hypothetical protein